MGTRICIMNGARGAGRPAARGLPPPGQHLRRGLPRQSADEPRCRPTLEAHATLVLGRQRIPLPAALGARTLQARTGGAVVFGIRPEDMSPADSPAPPQLGARLEAIVQAVELSAPRPSSSSGWKGLEKPRLHQSRPVCRRPPRRADRPRRRPRGGPPLRPPNHARDPAGHHAPLKGDYHGRTRNRTDHPPRLRARPR